jgi:hypothetical protein
MKKRENVRLVLVFSTKKVLLVMLNDVNSIRMSKAKNCQTGFSVLYKGNKTLLEGYLQKWLLAVIKVNKTRMSNECEKL